MRWMCRRCRRRRSPRGWKRAHRLRKNTAQGSAGWAVQPRRVAVRSGRAEHQSGGAAAACSFCARSYQRRIISLGRAAASDRAWRADGKHAVRRACPTVCYSGPAVVTASFTEWLEPLM